MLSTILSILFILILAGTIIVILVDEGDSGRRMAWLLIIAVLPVVGLILYLCFGINYRHHWIFNRRHQRFRDAFEKEGDARLETLLFEEGREADIREEFRPLARLLASDASPSVTTGNDVEVITSGARKYDLLLADIAQAKESIHLEYFHFGNDKGSRDVKQLLMQKAREGVKVRFINENIANFPIPARYYDGMKKAGVEIVRFTNPRFHTLNLVTSLNYRNHRKILVIDGRIGYTGGMNINDNYFLRWRDTHLRITGDGVAALQYTFLDSWLTGGGTLDRELTDYFPKPEAASPSVTAQTSPAAPAECPASRYDPAVPWRERIQPVLRDKALQIVPDEPDSHWPLIRMGYAWVFHNARRYIWLQTPYFVPPEEILNAMKAAALGGTDVRLMLPKNADNFLMRFANRSFYQEILGAGVRIFLRKGEFIHAKTFVCDDYLTSIGTANLDFRSFDINYEVNTYLYDEETALLNKAIFLEDLKACEELTLDVWSDRPWYHHISESLMRLFAPLL